MGLFVTNGMRELVAMVRSANAGMFVRHVLMQVSSGRSIRLLRMTRVARVRRAGSYSVSLSSVAAGEKWKVEDFLKAHQLVRQSGKCNFEHCRIPVPTAIRYDRLRIALGANATVKEERILSLLEFGMPINCIGRFGIRKPQKNHFSALAFKA